MRLANPHRYSYNFDWLGLPIIQYPADIVAVQELIWRVQPQVIVETGVARGGSLALSASILELLGGDRFVIGVELNCASTTVGRSRSIRSPTHTDCRRLVDGSRHRRRVRSLVGDRKPVLVFLDSNHTYEHVLAELDAYSPLRRARFVRRGVRHRGRAPSAPTPPTDRGTPATPRRPRPRSSWPVPTAASSSTRSSTRKLVITVAPGGYLRCVR